MKPQTDDEDDLKFEQEMRASIERNRAKREGRGQVVEFPTQLGEWELIKRQRIIDQTWERVLEERKAMERLMKSGCHRGPGDPDYSS